MSVDSPSRTSGGAFWACSKSFPLKKMKSYHFTDITKNFKHLTGIVDVQLDRCVGSVRPEADWNHGRGPSKRILQPHQCNVISPVSDVEPGMFQNPIHFMLGSRFRQLNNARLAVS